MAVRVGINMVDGELEVCRGSEHAVVLAASCDLVVCAYSTVGAPGWVENLTVRSNMLYRLKENF